MPTTVPAPRLRNGSLATASSSPVNPWAESRGVDGCTAPNIRQVLLWCQAACCRCLFKALYTHMRNWPQSGPARSCRNYVCFIAWWVSITSWIPTIFVRSKCFSIPCGLCFAGDIMIPRPNDQVACCRCPVKVSYPAGLGRSKLSGLCKAEIISQQTERVPKSTGRYLQSNWDIKHGTCLTTYFAY